MDTWRPSNWEELIKQRSDWVDRNSLEAGADIILEALRQEGNSRGGRVRNDEFRGTGTWVFLSDEKESG